MESKIILRLGFVGISALAFCSLLLGYGMSFLDSQYQPVSAVGFTASGFMMAFFSFAVGVTVLAIYGIPIYVVLSKTGKATWLNVLAAAVIPCLTVALLTTWKGSFLLKCFAFPIAMAMHAFHGRTQKGYCSSFEDVP